MSPLRVREFIRGDAMFDFVKRWFGGSAKEGAAATEYADPAQKRAWVATEKTRLREYFNGQSMFGENAELRPAWAVPPHVIVWAVPNGWAISGGVPFDHVVDQNDVIRSPRDAARFFGRRLRDHARKSKGADADALLRKAEAVLTAARLDTGWPDDFPLDEATLAPGPTAWQRAERSLRGPLFKPDTAPPLASALRILHREEEAPGGPFHGLYFCLDVSAPTPELFDALANKLLAVETQFAPLVAHRVQYVLVFFGVNHGMPDQEIEACRLADKMRERHPELSRRIDDYGPAGENLLPVHFVDDGDVPFTAHPCAVRDPAKPYAAEKTYFNCREQPFHQTMEASADPALRLIAGSIAPDVVKEARKAFAR